MHIFWRFVVNTSKIGRCIGTKTQRIRRLNSNYLNSRFSLKKLPSKCYSSLNYQYLDLESSEHVQKAISMLSYQTEFWNFDLLIFYCHFTKKLTQMLVKTFHQWNSSLPYHSPLTVVKDKTLKLYKRVNGPLYLFGSTIVCIIINM